MTRATALTRADLATTRGRRRAWRDLMFADHGIVRKLYDNTHQVSPGMMWRSYQPSPSDLKKWKRRGVKTVINLRGESAHGSYLLEEEACEALGLALETFRVYSREAPSTEILRGARALFERIEYPALMHCKSGADRAGLMATLYMFFHEGRPLNEAVDQLSIKYGHVKKGKTGVIDYAFEQYLDYARANAKSLSSLDDFFDWADHHYDHRKTKETFLGSWWGNILTESILRRE